MVLTPEHEAILCAIYNAEQSGADPSAAAVAAVAHLSNQEYGNHLAHLVDHGYIEAHMVKSGSGAWAMTMVERATANGRDLAVDICLGDA